MTAVAPSPPRRRRLLLCHNYYREHGGESHVFDLEAEALRRQGHDVTLYTRRNEEVDSAGLPARLRLLADGYGSRRTEREIAALVTEKRPELALVQNVFHLLTPSTYTSLYRAGVPIVQSVYNYRLVCANAELYVSGRICERCVRGSAWNAVLHRCYRGSALQSAWLSSIIALHRGRRTFADLVDVFMVPDRFLGAKLVEGGIPAAKIRTNPNPLDVDAYQPYDRHDGYVLYVGRLTPQKGIRTLLRATTLLASGLRVLIVGIGELEMEVREWVRAAGTSGRISFLGAVWGDDLKRLAARSAAVVVPSEWYDNLPQIVCQANALGKPVIASRINGIPEYIVPGENGELFPPGDAAELGAAIDGIAALDPATYAVRSRSARAYAEREFDYSVHHRRLNSIFDEVCRK